MKEALKDYSKLEQQLTSLRNKMQEQREEFITKLEALKHTGYDSDFVSWEDIIKIRDYYNTLTDKEA